MEGRFEGFEIFLGRFLEEDGVEGFGSLNVNFELFSIFRSFKRDLGIHIDFNFSLDALEHTSLIMDLEIHTYFDLSL